MTDTERTFNTAAGPSNSPQPDIGQLREQVMGYARVDAASGAFDVPMLELHQGLLPRERQIVAEQQRRVPEARIDSINARKIDLKHRYEALDDTIDERTALQQQKKQLEDEIEDAERRRAPQAAIIAGTTKDHDGASYTAAEPPVPVIATGTSVRKARRQLALRPTRVVRWFTDIGATMLFLLIETGVITVTVATVIRTDDMGHALVISAAGVLLVTLVPHFLGITLGALLRGAPFTGRRIATLCLGVFWIAAVIVLAWLRTSAEETRRRTVIATAQNIAPQDVDLTGQFDFGAQLALWTAFVAGAGIGLIFLKIKAYNPALTAVVRADNVIALKKHQLAPVLAGLARITARLEAFTQAHTEVTSLTPGEYDVFAKQVLPALTRELLALYRATLVNALANPEATGVLAENSAEPTALSPVVDLPVATASDEHGTGQAGGAA